jgi:hypothetical protein
MSCKDDKCSYGHSQIELDAINNAKMYIEDYLRGYISQEQLQLDLYNQRRILENVQEGQLELALNDKRIIKPLNELESKLDESPLQHWDERAVEIIKRLTEEEKEKIRKKGL